MNRSAVLAAAAAVLVLAGCSPQDIGMVTLERGELVFMSCDEISGVQHISVDADGLDTWHSRGDDGVFGPGLPLYYGVDPAGFETDIGPEEVSLAGDTVSFALVNTAVRTVVVQFDSGAIVEGKWLDQNGKLHDRPCGL